MSKITGPHIVPLIATICHLLYNPAGFQCFALQVHNNLHNSLRYLHNGPFLDRSLIFFFCQNPLMTLKCYIW